MDLIQTIAHEAYKIYDADKRRVGQWTQEAGPGDYAAFSDAIRKSFEVLNITEITQIEKQPQDKEISGEQT